MLQTFRIFAGNPNPPVRSLMGQRISAFEPMMQNPECKDEILDFSSFPGGLTDTTAVSRRWLADAPDASLVTGSRDTTLTPLQSLFLLNNRFVQDQAVEISNRVMKQPANHRLDYAYRLMLGRLPSPSERKLVLDYLTDEEKLPLVCQALLSTVEFSSID